MKEVGLVASTEFASSDGGGGDPEGMLRMEVVPWGGKGERMNKGYK